MITALIAAASTSLAADPPALPAVVMRSVSDERCRTTIDALASFGTRHTLSEGAPGPRGITAARAWIVAEMTAAAGASKGRLTVAEERFDAPKSARTPQGATVVNVVGVLAGVGPTADRRVYVVGHYDTRNGEPLDAAGDAPGANDDGSGTTVVIELARALAPIELESTVVFLCTAGEEQSLLGARFHADTARTAGHRITAVLNNDIVGDPTSPGKPGAPGRHVIRLFSEGIPRNPSAETLAQIRALAAENDSPSRQLARYVADIAAREHTAIQPRLIFRLDRFLRGGDHSSFLENGYAAVRFTETDENYSRQHQNITTETGPDGKTFRTGDVPEAVDASYVADVARLNAAAIVHLANAPSAPSRVRVLTAELSNDTTIRWDRSPEPDVAGYEVVWRDTTAPTWEHTHDAGNATEAVLDLSKDDVFFGVRAYDKDGYRSLVTFAAAGVE